MKTCWPAVLALTALACGAPSPPPPPPPPAASATAPAVASSPAPGPTTKPEAPAPSLFDLQVKNLQAYVRAFNQHDAKAIAALYAEDAVFVERGEFVSSGGAIEATYKEYFEAFPDASTSITRSWHHGTTVVFEFVEGGTHSGPHRVHKPSGKRVGYVGASWLEFSPDGRVTKDTTYSDELTKEIQAGWAPATLAKIKVRPVISVPPATDTWEIHKVADKDTGSKGLAAKRSLYSELSLRSERDFLAGLSDDVVLMAYDDPADAKGHKEASALFKEWTRSFSSGAVEATEGWVVDGYYLVLGTYTGKHVGNWGPLPATNKTFTTHFLDIAKVAKNDKVERVWSYANNYELLRQLGYHKTDKPSASAPK